MRRKRIKIEGPTEKTSFNLPVTLLTELHDVSGDRGMTQVAAVIQAIRDWLDKPSDGGPVVLPVPGKPPATLLTAHSLLPENVTNLSPEDLEWLRRLVGVAVERPNARDKEDEPGSHDPPADLGAIAEAAREKEAGVIEATEEFGRPVQADSPVRGRVGKRGGRPPKPPGGGSGD